MSNSLADAIAQMKKSKSAIKTVKVDVFDIPEKTAEEYKRNRAWCAEAVKEIMAPYCEKVVIETLDPVEGECVVGYYYTGDILMTVALDPFEVPVMKMAAENNRLREYIMAANDLTEEMLGMALTQWKEHTLK